MKSRLMACAAGLALGVGFGMSAAIAADLKFAPGEGPFNWDSYNAWAEKRA